MPFQGENAAAKDGPEGFNSDSEIPSEDIRCRISTTFNEHLFV
jgi:hypothetical protein